MKKRRRSKKTLSHWLTNRYVLIVRNEENFAEKSTFSFSYAKLIVFVFSVFTIFLFVSLYLVKSILAQWFDPRTEQIETNQKLIELSMDIDSLARQVEIKDAFINNLKGVIMGEDSIDVQYTYSEREIIDNMNREVDLSQTARIDSQFRREFEEYGVSLASTANIYSEQLEEIFYFTPVSGIVSSPYHPASDHYGVDIVARDNEPIKAVAEGTIIFSGWTQEYGYTSI